MKTAKPLALGSKKIEQSKASERKDGERKSKKSWLGRKITLRKKGVRPEAEKEACAECCAITAVGFGALMCMTIVLIPCGLPLIYFGVKGLIEENSSSSW